MNLKLNNLKGKRLKITIVNNEKKADFITHSGTFHADEVMATCILLNKFGSIKLFRCNNVTKKDAFVYDIGSGSFDHHQKDFDEKRENGIKYASCGLVWRSFGKDILSKISDTYVDDLFEKIDKRLIMDIDRDDNGISLENPTDKMVLSLPSIISNFNPAWNDSSSENECFLKAVLYANMVFNNLVRRLKANLDAKSVIEEKIDKSSNGILILDKYMPWKDVILNSKNEKANNILYAIFPSKRGGYNIVAAPEKGDSFNVKKPFPKEWGGLVNDELQEISKVETITFCHKGLFICACKTYEDALKIANIAINNND